MSFNSQRPSTMCNNKHSNTDCTSNSVNPTIDSQMNLIQTPVSKENSKSEKSTQPKNDRDS